MKENELIRHLTRICTAFLMLPIGILKFYTVASLPTAWVLRQIETLQSEKITKLVKNTADHIKARRPEGRRAPGKKRDITAKEDGAWALRAAEITSG